MSFKGAGIELKFNDLGNTQNRWYDKETFCTDFKTGRAWVQPELYLRVYRDGGVSLHTTGRRDPIARRALAKYGIDVQLFSEVRGKLSTSDGVPMARAHITDHPDTVLVEGDRIYPLYSRRASECPQDSIPGMFTIGYPAVVWESQTRMPVCNDWFNITTPNKQRAAEWWAKNEERVTVERVAGMLDNDGNNYSYEGIPRSALEKIDAGGTLNRFEARELARCSLPIIHQRINHITSDKVKAEYLVVKP